MKKYILAAVGILFGAAGGYAYFHYFGCTNGCPIKSNAGLMMAYGGLLGMVTLQTIDEIVIKVRSAKRLEKGRDEAVTPE